MIIPDLKKAYTTVMARRSPKGDVISAPAPMKEEHSLTEPGEQDPRHAAAQDILSAMHEKSPQRLLEAMANFHDLHAMHSEKSESESEEK